MHAHILHQSQWWGIQVWSDSVHICCTDLTCFTSTTISPKLEHTAHQINVRYKISYTVTNRRPNNNSKKCAEKIVLGEQNRTNTNSMDTQACTHTDTQVCTHTDTQVCTHTDTQVCTHTDTKVCTHTDTQACTHKDTQACTHKDTQACTHKDTQACTHKDTLACTHTDTQACTHTDTQACTPPPPPTTTAKGALKK